jgi:hypothetical protein
MPRHTPRKVSIAVKVPTTCSPYGKPQMPDNVKYNVAIAGITI